jgi:HlyD family secretion protein
VVLERWGGTPLEARVRRVEPVGFTKVSALGVEEQRVWVIVDLAAPAEASRQLGDGYRVEASFVLWSGDAVLQAPSSAVFRDGDGWAAFVVEGEVARRRPVTLGHRAGLAVEVAAGLTAGEQVITHPADEVVDGARVVLRD